MQITRSDASYSSAQAEVLGICYADIKSHLTPACTPSCLIRWRKAIKAGSNLIQQLFPTPKSTCYSLRSAGLGLSLTSLDPTASYTRKHSLIAWYLRIVIKLSTLSTVSFSSLHCCVFGFSCHFVLMVFIVLSFMRLSWCILHIINEMKWKKSAGCCPPMLPGWCAWLFQRGCSSILSGILSALFILSQSLQWGP